MHLSQQVKSKCWNSYESCGELCVHCGCCSTNTLLRTKARLSMLKRQLKEKENFKDWAYEYPELLEIQKKNNVDWIKYFKKKIVYYEQRLKKLGETNE